MPAWNTRYVEFARSRGRSPQAQLARDRSEHTGRGSVMLDFALWIGDRWRDWSKLRERDRHAGKSSADHADFDQWLSGWVDRAK